jgi:acetyl esterase/lipase
MATEPADRRGVVWTVDNLSSIGGHPVQVLGNPRVVSTDVGPAVEFDGVDDGLLLDVNPLQGLPRFTVEVFFQPDADGPEEQRFFHAEEAGTGNRALIELRRLSEAKWTLDTYLRQGQAGLTLLDRSRLHVTGRWHVASLTYDGKTMTHFVNGQKELSGETAFGPLGAGTTSIGVRQNKVSFFKGRIRQIRISPDVVPTERLLTGSAASVPLQGTVIPLWPEGVPGAKSGGGQERLDNERVYNVQNPTLTWIPATPGTGNGTALILCPGGGYVRLAIAKEAESVARLLAPLGVTTFILKYRMVEFGHPAPLQDILRAVRVVRSRAADFGVRPDRVGVFGASAGGHVAAMGATLFEAPEGRTGSPLDAVSARPDFAVLLYPVITMKEDLTHTGSRKALIGENPASALVDRLSLETQVTRATPPTFIVHSGDDPSVPLENSLLFVQALRRHAVPTEFHVYERGGHGFGTAPDLGPTSEWPRRLEEWMRSHGWLTREAK